MNRFLLSLAVSVVAVCAALPGLASAATFCVNGPCPSGAQTHANLDVAIAAAASSTGRDRIEIGAGPLSTSSTVAPGNSVDIVGAGRGSTVLSIDGGAYPVLYLGDAASSVSDLGFSITTGTALQTAGLAERIDVGGAAAGATGITVLFNGILRNANVTLPVSSGNFGVATAGSAGQTATVEDSRIAAFVGLDAQTSANARRLAISANQGARVGDGTLNLSSSLIRVSGSFARALSASTSLGPAPVLNAAHVTAVAEPGATDAAGADASGGNSGRTATVRLRNSILRGFTSDIRREATSGTANLEVAFSDFSTRSDSGAGTLTEGAGNVDVDPRYRNPAAGDFRLTAASPLVDSGDPAGLLPFEAPLDQGLLPRIVDGNGDGDARSDMGAHERQGPAGATAGVAPVVVEVGRPARFSGSATNIDGDPLSYSWSFDDGTSANGQAVDKSFGSSGTHTATLSVSDAAGARSTASVAVEVVDVFNPRPVVSGLSVLPRVFGVGRPPLGTTIRFTLSEAAGLRLIIDRALPGRRVGGRCARATPRNRRARRCVRYRRAGVFNRPGVAGPNRLAWTGRIGRRVPGPGAYRLTVIATDSSGAASQPRRINFRLLG